MAYLLEIPWESSRYFLMRYRGKLRARGGSLFIYDDQTLPAELKEFTTDDFTYARWIEDDFRIAGRQSPITPLKSNTIFKPRPHQMDAAKKIFKSYYGGWRGFLEADKTGLGKTLSTLTGVTAIAKKEGFTTSNRATLLVVCPKGVIPVWRQTLHNYPSSTALMRVLVINYQQLNKLLTKPKGVGKAKKQRTKNRMIAKDGVPTVNWNYIIFDEAHYLKNYPSSAVSMSAASIAQVNKRYVKGKTPFVIFSTATPGSSPLNFAMMAGFVGKLLSASANEKTVTPDNWGEYLISQGFSVKSTKSGYTWASVPWFGKDSKDPRERAQYQRRLKAAKAEQRKDALRIGKALKKPNAPFIMRSPTDIAGWPEQQFVPLPLELTLEQRPIYEEAWTRFRNWLRLTPAHSDPKGALVETLRYRQKSSLLKVDSMVDQVADFVDAGYQVYISVQFIETLDAYKEKLKARKIECSEVSGRTTKERELERIRFQKGDTKVVLSTVVEGVSFHAKETLPDGSPATSAARISIIHDIRQNPLDTLQACGRCHRDGQNSLIYMPYFEETVDERVITSFVNKEANLKAMTGSEQSKVEELEDLFRAAAEASTNGGAKRT